MRPITKPNNPAFYAEPAPTFIVIKGKQNNASVTIQEFYNFFTTRDWFVLDGKKPPDPQEKTDLEKKKLYVKKLDKFYGAARYDLIESIGEFCSYCGIPIRDDAHVEHVSPKAWFPAQMLLWDNFLIACRDCNSRKSSNPTGAQNDTLNDFVWPHVDLKGRMIGHLLATYENSYVDGNARTAPVPNGEISVTYLARLMWMGHIKITVAKAVSPQSEGAREVVLEFTKSRKTYNIAALVIGTTGKARALINDIFKLNTYTDSPEVSDRRMTERTLAWIQAVDAVRNVIDVRSAPDAVRRAVFEQVTDTILATGFWLVWAEVFIVEGPQALEPEECDFISVILRSNRFPGTAAGRLFFS